MRWPLLLLALLAALAAATSVAVTTGEPPTARGVGHPEYPMLLRGDSGAGRHERVLVAGWAAGVLILAFSVALLAWGYRRQRRMAVPLAAGFILQAALFTVVIVAYARWMHEPAPQLWWALPVPTAWLVYLFWPAQFVFVILFVATFDQSYWTPDDERRLREIVAGRGGGAGTEP